MPRIFSRQQFLPPAPSTNFVSSVLWGFCMWGTATAYGDTPSWFFMAASILSTLLSAFYLGRAFWLVMHPRQSPRQAAYERIEAMAAVDVSATGINREPNPYWQNRRAH